MSQSSLALQWHWLPYLPQLHQILSQGHYVDTPNIRTERAKELFGSFLPWLSLRIGAHHQKQEGSYRSFVPSTKGTGLSASETTYLINSCQMQMDCLVSWRALVALLCPQGRTGWENSGDLWRFTVATPCNSRYNFKITEVCSALCPADFVVPPKMEVLQPLWASVSMVHACQWEAFLISLLQLVTVAH